MEVFHEPFGEPFYHSKERLSARYEDDEEARKASGHSEDTYKTVFDQILEADSEVGLFPSSRLLLLLYSIRLLLLSFPVIPTHTARSSHRRNAKYIHFLARPTSAALPVSCPLLVTSDPCAANPSRLPLPSPASLASVPFAR